VSFCGAYIGRKLGWFISRRALYEGPLWFVSAVCIGWGMLVAYGVCFLSEWIQPNVIVKIIFGWCQGAYVATPNFGLLDESSIPEYLKPRHDLIFMLPVWSYIAGMLLLNRFLPSATIQAVIN
jgi:hypothetical protein